MSAVCITLLTDFGLRDAYVAAMKGVILTRCADARLVDVTHEIAPGDIAAAAYVLRQAAPYFPKGSVHLVVVDPGVGSKRRGIACEAGGQRFVAPDNGVLAAVLKLYPPTRVHRLSNAELWRAEPSAVFHGRDVFGPVAAHLAAGGSFESVGEALDPAQLEQRAWPEPRREGDAWRGEVIYIDRFGNLVTNLPLDGALPAVGEVQIGTRRVPWVRTYSDVPEGTLLALRGSSNLLEIACNRGSAAERLQGTRGLVVTFRAHSGS